jgi:glycosyltransferase involved in cell wall biosynthesis
MPLRIAIDASRTTVAHLTGTEHYALRLIQSLIITNDKREIPYQLKLYFRDTPQSDLFPASAYVEQFVIPFSRAWTHWRFAQEIWKTRPDITFVPAHTLPFIFPGKSVVTVHDLGYKYFPDAHPTRQRLYLDLTTRYSQARATAILVDSQATADDLNTFYGTSSEKIKVIYPGVDSQPLLDTIQASDTIRAKYKLPERYFLFIGTLQPRKNIQRIVQAFAQWQHQHDNQDTALVLAGGQGWLFDETWVTDVKNVILTGYIDEADKSTLLRGAISLVFPTLYEGFGFPVIEAMHCGTPVIASTTSSLPELVGNAGLLVNPEDVSAIADAMTQYSENNTLREEMIHAGYQQAKQSTWDKAAHDTMSVFDKIKNTL